MKGPSVRLAALVGLGVAGAIALTRRGSGVATGHAVDGGVLMGDPAGYDRLSRLLKCAELRGFTDALVEPELPLGEVVLRTTHPNVSVVPAGVEILTRAGHQVIVETGAGVGTSISDEEYAEQGAEIAGDAAVYCDPRDIGSIRGALDRVLRDR